MKPVTPAATGVDAIDERQHLIDRVAELRERDHLLVARVKRLALLMVPLTVLAAVALMVFAPSFIRLGCVSRQSEAKSNLMALGVAMASFHAAFGHYTTDIAALGFSPQGSVRRYAYFLRVDGQSEFTAVAIGVDASVAGDVWALSERGDLRQVEKACGRGPYREPNTQ